MRYVNIIFFVFLIMGCDTFTKEKIIVKDNEIKPFKSMKMYIEWQLTDANKSASFTDARSYFQYKNRDQVKETLTLVDSVKVGEFWFVFYKYDINGAKFYNADTFLKMDGCYFSMGFIWISYRLEDYFDGSDINIARAYGDKIKKWKQKSTKRWWNYKNISSK